MIYYPLSALINAVTSFIIGTFVLSVNYKSKVNRAFAYFCYCVFIWSIGYYLWQITDNYSSAFFWSQFLSMGAILIPFYYLSFTINFLKLGIKKIYVFFLGFIAYGLSILSYTDFIVTGVESKLNFEYWPLPGTIYPFYLIIFFGYFLLSTYLLFVSFKTATGIKREQLKYLLFGMVIAFLGGSTNFLLWYDIPYPPVFNIFVTGYVLAGTYAIVRYRLMDIRVVIKRSFIFAVLVLAITAVYALLAYLISVFFQNLIGTQSIILNGVITAVLVAVGFEPLKKWLSRLTDSFLFKGEYKADKLLAHVADTMASTLDLKKLLNNLSTLLYEAFRCKKFSVFLYDEVKDCFDENALIGMRRKVPLCFPGNSIKEYYKTLKKLGDQKSLLVRDEIQRLYEDTNQESLKNIVERLDSHSADVIVPIFLHDKLSGLFFVGEKKSGDVYTDQDLNILEIIAGQAATAIDNAKLYEEQKAFNVKLRREVKKATEELRVANRELKKLDKAKSDFISIASHQLRTPLTAIRGYTNMVLTGDFGKFPKKVGDPLKKVESSTVRIINLVNDLLNISRIESGRMQYEFEKEDLRTIVEDVCHEVEVIAHKKGLKFNCILPKEKFPKLLMDRKKIREVVMNLADNAVKYTDKGTIDIRLEKQDNEVLYYVKDTGRGIAKSDVEKLFKKFSRVEGASMVKAEGTGLGLYIAEQIVAKHHGKLWVESEGENKGSTFYLSIPIENKKLENDLKRAGSNVLEKRE